MAEPSDAFKQLDTVGKLRYNEKLGMLGIKTDPYMTPKDAWDYNPSRWPDQGRRNRSGKSGFRRSSFPPAINFFKNVCQFILLYNNQVIASESLINCMI